MSKGAFYLWTLAFVAVIAAGPHYWALWFDAVVDVITHMG